jgi:hypothetical protein
MIIDLIVGLATKALGLGSGILERKQKLEEIKLDGATKVAVAQAEAEIARLNKSIDAEITWDTEAIKQMEHSWKDEYLTLMLSAPMILAFLGDWGRTAVAEGFRAIQGAPDWYKVAFLTTIAASFGIRALVDKFGFGKK